MPFHVTQCPSCESTFNTSPQVLIAAAGKVRCGACLTVFEARANFLAEDSLDEPGEESVFVSAAPTDYFDPSVFLTRSALRAEDTHQELEPDTPTIDLPGTEAAPATQDPTALSLSFSGHLHASSAEEEQAARDFNAEIEAQDFHDSIAESRNSVDTSPAAGHDSDGPYQELEAFNALIDQGEVEPAPEPDSGDDSADVIRARVLKTQLEDDQALETIPKEHLAVLGQFSSPLEFIAGARRQWRRQLGWTMLALLLGALLSGQYLWQEIALYSQSERLRPLYTWACNTLNCDVPAYSDIAAIRSDILTVRSHPRQPNGLMVNIEFRNTAPFPQPFPILVLSFNSASNSVMALREFAPAEYLDAQLAGRELMPVMNPVQVDLEIIDPGPDAVNYTLAFRRP